MQKRCIHVLLLVICCLVSQPARGRERCSASQIKLASQAPALLAKQWASKEGATRALVALRKYAVKQVASDANHRKVYLAHRKCFGVGAFWRAVVRSTKLGRCDMKLYRPALDAAMEQARRDRSNFRQAIYYCRRRPPKDQLRGATGWYEETRAMMYLLTGQRDDPKMMNIYKACYRDHGLSLIEAVARRRPWARQRKTRQKKK